MDLSIELSERPSPPCRAIQPSEAVFQLKACTSLESIRKFEIEYSFGTSSISVANTLISKYAKYGSLLDARQVFERMHNRSVISWNTLIWGYVENGEDEQALTLYESLLVDEHCSPNHRTFVAALKACINLTAKENPQILEHESYVKTGSLQKGLVIHVDALNRGFESHSFVATSLINMYAKCGSTVDARRMFESMPFRSTVSWTSMILGHAENGEDETAVDLFARMLEEGYEPDSATFVAVLKSCIALSSLEQGISFHFQAAVSGCDSHIQVANTLIKMYGNLGAMVDASTVFERIQNPTVVSWTSLMLAYVECGQANRALELFSIMLQIEVCKPDVPCYIAAFKACALLEGKSNSLETGCAIHSRVAASDIAHISVTNVMIDMYAKCGSLLDAKLIFDKMLLRNTVSWSTLISGYVYHGEEETALELFASMRLEGCVPDCATFVAALNGCTAMASKEKRPKPKVVPLEKGITIHIEACENGCDREILVENTLVDMYAKCGSMVDAMKVFVAMKQRSVVSWTALMSGYVDSGEAEKALELFGDMRGEGLVPDSLCFVAAVRACCRMNSLEVGKEIHADICRHKLENDPLVMNSLVHFYGTCGSMVDAQRVFDTMMS